MTAIPPPPLHQFHNNNNNNNNNDSNDDDVFSLFRRHFHRVVSHQCNHHKSTDPPITEMSQQRHVNGNSMMLNHFLKQKFAHYKGKFHTVVRTLDSCAQYITGCVRSYYTVLLYSMKQHGRSSSTTMEQHQELDMSSIEMRQLMSETNATAVRVPITGHRSVVHIGKESVQLFERLLLHSSHLREYDLFMGYSALVFREISEARELVASTYHRFLASFDTFQRRFAFASHDDLSDEKHVSTSKLDRSVGDLFAQFVDEQKRHVCEIALSQGMKEKMDSDTGYEDAENMILQLIDDGERLFLRGQLHIVLPPRQTQATGENVTRARRQKKRTARVKTSPASNNVERDSTRITTSKSATAKGAVTETMESNNRSSIMSPMDTIADLLRLHHSSCAAYNQQDRRFIRWDGSEVTIPESADHFDRVMFLKTRRRTKRILSSSSHTLQQKQMALSEYMRLLRW